MSVKIQAIDSGIVKINVENRHVAQCQIAKLCILELSLDEVHIPESAIEEGWSRRLGVVRVVVDILQGVVAVIISLAFGLQLVSAQLKLCRQRMDRCVD
jgi:hypothetical protein